MPITMPAGLGQLPWFAPIPPNGITSAQAFPTANAAYGFRGRVSAPLAVSKIQYSVGAAAGNVDLGIYTSTDEGTTLTRIASTGSTAVSGSSTTQTINLTAAVTLAPGVDYWLFITADTITTLTIPRSSIPAAVGNPGNYYCSKASSFPLPSSIGSPLTSTIMFYLVALP